MNPAAIALVLGAAMAHAAWNFSAKRASAGGPLFVWLYQAASAVVCMPVAVGALLVTDATPHWNWLLAFAHVTLVLLRAMGIPTRDVSGYLHTKPDSEPKETVRGQSHAWTGGWWATTRRTRSQSGQGTSGSP